MSKKKTAPKKRCRLYFLLVHVFLKISYDVTDRNELVKILVLDFNAELVFAHENKVCKPFRYAKRQCKKQTCKA